MKALPRSSGKVDALTANGIRDCIAIAASHRLAKILELRILSAKGVRARLFKGHNEEATSLLRAALNHKAGWAVGYCALVVALTRLGRNDEAQRAARQMLELDPGYCLSTLNFPFRDENLKQEWLPALRVAGVPD